ncbi:MAG: Ribosomal RNA small subunit methyltransferase B [Alphaproteobacteria bacterium MarineAlpha2_Bin1]|nr:MAG: Ribosomal RNA small subunit methyltransferase B [Alphaproteobacteria bacterium MarineAlpha2_Bin1]
MKIKKNDTRSFALKILYNILHKNIFFSDALIRYENDFEEFNDKDKKYIYQLIITVIRRLGYIERIINLHLQKPIKNPEIKIVLGIGVAQIIYLRTPDYAAVNQTVNIIKPKLNSFKPLVNAILRKIAKNQEKYFNITNSTKHMLPSWILKKWEKNHGENNTKLIIKSLLSEPYIDISIKTSENKIFEQLNTQVLPNGTIRLKNHYKISSLPKYREGNWWVQDAAATIPGSLLINKLKNNPDKKLVIDACAAPGGKSIQLLRSGLEVISIDRNKERINTMIKNLKRMNLTYNIIDNNFLNWNPTSLDISGILLDAPCSGTGTLRRNPDIIWSRKKRDIENLSRIQIKLLKHSLKILRPGGTLVYAVCSIEPEEGINIARKALSWPNVELSKISDEELPKLEESITKEGFVQILPHYWSEFGGLDGFFIARFEKK